MSSVINSVGNALTGITGTGTFVGANTPTLNTPVLGTPTSGVLTNCTGYVSSNLTGALSINASAPSGSITASSAGYITRPNGPSFSAYIGASQSNVTGDGTSYVVIFDTIITNVSSSYNNSTGIFTVPVTGVYQFSYILTSSGIVPGVNTSVEILISNGTPYPLALEGPPTGSTTGSLLTFSGSFTLACAATNAVSITFVVSGATKVVSLFQTGGAIYNNFSGCLIG